MSKSSAVVSFFSGLSQAFGYLGSGWYPSGAVDGSPPFRSIRSEAGVVVSPGAALQLAAVYACVRLIAETISTLPIELLAPDDTGRMVPQSNSATWRMLAIRPNAYMTAVEFWEMIGVSLCFWGNAFALKVRIAGRVVALNPFRPEYMTVYRTADGEIRYAYMRGMVREEYSSDDILHIKGFGVDGLIGLSPIQMARQTIGRAMATDTASSKLFAGGMSASGVIYYDKALNEETRGQVTDTINRFTGSAGVGKTMVLENGMKYEAIQIQPRDAQLLESRMFNVEEICRWHGVPPQLIGHITKSSSWASSLENTTLGWVKFGLRALLTRIEQSCQRSLALPAGTTMVFNLRELLRGDTAARMAYDSGAAQNGLRTRNELRVDDGLPPLTDENADKLTVQSNLTLLGKVGETPPAPAGPNAGDVPPATPGATNTPKDPAK